MGDLERYGTRLLRLTAERISEGITTGHDWPNTNDELARLQAARLLRESADEIEALRNWARLAFRALNNVGPALRDQECESCAERALVDRVCELAQAAAGQYQIIARVHYAEAERDARAALTPQEAAC